MSRAALAVIAIVAVNGAPALRAQGSAAQPSVIVTQGDASVKRTPNQAWVLVEYQGLQGWTFVLNVRLVAGNFSVLPRGDQ